MCPHGAPAGVSRGEESEEGGDGYIFGERPKEGPPFLFVIKFGPRHPQFSPWLSLGHFRWFFGALLLRLGMLWWRWVLSSRFLLIFGGLREVPGWSLCSSNILNNEVC